MRTNMSRFLRAIGLSVVAVAMVLVASLGAGQRSTSFGLAALAVLDGARNYNGAYPTPGSVEFTTKDGRRVTVKGFPGQVQVFAQVAADQSAVESGIVSKGSTVLSKIPQIGYYLVAVAAGAEGTFISSARSISGVVDAIPNTAMRVRADPVQIGEEYFLTAQPVPLNVGPGVIVIDQNFNAGGHGNGVATTVTANGGTVGAVVNLAIQCVGCNGETSAHHIGLILAAAIHGNSVFNPGTPFISNISFGPELPNDLLAEQATAAQVAQNQADNETFLQSILMVTARVPAAESDFTVTFALGNSHVDLASTMANLRNTPELAATLHDHFILAGTTQPFSNRVDAHDFDVVTSNNPQAAAGTSFAAPAVGAAIQVIRSQTGTGRDVAALAVKLSDDIEGQVVVARGSAMATQIASALPQVMTLAGVTRGQALLAIEHAVQANPTGQLVLVESVAEAVVQKTQGSCCVESNGCPGETGSACGSGCCCCGPGQRCSADTKLGCTFVGYGSLTGDLLRIGIRKVPFVASLFPQPACPPRTTTAAPLAPVQKPGSSPLNSR